MSKSCFNCGYHIKTKTEFGCCHCEAIVNDILEDDQPCILWELDYPIYMKEDNEIYKI